MSATVRRRGYVYKTVAIPEAAYARVEAYANRMGLPITTTVGLLLNVATGPHGMTMTPEQDLEAGPEIIDQVLALRRMRRSDVGGTHSREGWSKKSAGAGT
jgi:hypothetical protein